MFRKARFPTAKQRLEARFPSIDGSADRRRFLAIRWQLRADLASRPRVGFFPGSTIGNLTPPDAVRLLRTFKAALPRESRLIIGIDLKKDARQLVMALQRCGRRHRRVQSQSARAHQPRTRQHDSTLKPSAMRRSTSRARAASRCTSSAAIAQAVWISGRPFHFEAGERIHTENSYKYSIPQFQELARAASWAPNRVWTDPQQQFSVHELTSV